MSNDNCWDQILDRFLDDDDLYDQAITTVKTKDKVIKELLGKNKQYNLSNLVDNNGFRDLTDFIVGHLNIEEFYYLNIMEVKTYIELYKNKNENTITMYFSKMSCDRCYSDDQFKLIYENRSCFRSKIDSLIEKSKDFDYEFDYDYDYDSNEDEDEYDPEEDSSYYAYGTISIPMMYFLEHFCHNKINTNDFESYIIDIIL